MQFIEDSSMSTIFDINKIKEICNKFDFSLSSKDKLKFSSFNKIKTFKKLKTIWQLKMQNYLKVYSL